MRRRRMDHEYRDRRDEIRIEQADIKRRERRYRDRREQVPPPRTVQGKRTQRRRAMERKRRRQGVFIILGVILFIIAVYGGSKLYVAVDKYQSKAEKSDFTVNAKKTIEGADEIVNLAIFGTDEDGFRADVNMVASFNTNTKELHLIAVPRDTRVVMTDEMISYLEKNNMTVPQQNGVYGQCKLTELYAYAGSGNRNTFAVSMLENILGLNIQYYVKVDLSAFRDIVDAVGGVDFEVQERLYYSDPYQDLYIDLYPGMQHLDGDKAEQLVRFREGYAQKDLKRIQVQQSFMRAFLEKLCSTESILNNMSSLIQIALEKTESNITLSDALEYVKYLNDIDPSDMTTDTIPGEGGSYFDMDEEGTRELIDSLIYGITSEDTQNSGDMS